MVIKHKIEGSPDYRSIGCPRCERFINRSDWIDQNTDLMPNQTDTKPSYDDLVALLGEWLASPSTEYSGEGDTGPGSCIHCGALSYRPHEDFCITTRTRNMLAKEEGN